MSPEQQQILKQDCLVAIATLEQGGTQSVFDLICRKMKIFMEMFNHTARVLPNTTIGCEMARQDLTARSCHALHGHGFEEFSGAKLLKLLHTLDASGALVLHMMDMETTDAGKYITEAALVEVVLKGGKMELRSICSFDSIGGLSDADRQSYLDHISKLKGVGCWGGPEFRFLRDAGQGQKCM